MEEDNNHIKVVCRIRPANARELNGGLRQSVQAKEANIIANTKPEARSFTFDYAAGECVTQEEIFNEVGVPVTKSCVEGYNGTILCYGQTGSGKTYTIFGPDTANSINDEDEEAMQQRGLVPRVLDYIWEHLAQDEVTPAGTKSFSCRCSFYEIYQERVFDLLDSSSNTNERGLSVREDAKHGVYVEGCTEEQVNSPLDAKRVLALGYRNRHVGATSMNRESSRSHAVFQLVIDTTTEKQGVRTVKTARFSMIDLAGSERQKDTNASGERLKEASQINKSLSALGNVINALAAVSSSGGRKHIHYRDSKLTFLLRDSLGGNSKTTLVGTLSPADVSLAESLSTLKFCQRAKSIKNNAIINEETAGSMEALQHEILALKSQLSQYSTIDNDNTANLTPSKIRSPSRYVITSPNSRKNLTCKDRYNATATEKLLKESLLRTKSVEECAARNDTIIKDLNAQLHSAENFALSMKMKVKMRDSEIQRLKKKEGVATDPSISEIVKVEVDAVRQELQSEVVKFQLACKEAERRLALYEEPKQSDTLNAKKGPTTPFSLWNNPLEINFQHELATTLASLELKNEEFQQHVEDMGKGMFLGYFGFTMEEAQELRPQNAELKSKLDELTITSDATKMALTNALSTNAELEACLMETKGEYESKKCEFECEKLQLSATISCLKEENLEKTNTISILQGNLKRTDDEMVKARQDKEKELRDQHNSLMKDNMILVQSSRELEATVQRKSKSLEQKCAMIASLDEKVSYVCAQMELAGNKHKESLQAIQEKLNDSNHLIITQKALLAENNERMEELEAANQSWSEEAKGLTLQLQTTTSELYEVQQELESSVETADNLNSQAETLIANLDETKALHASAIDKISELQGEITELQGRLNDTQKEISTETALRQELETALTETNASLSASEKTNKVLCEEICQHKATNDKLQLTIVALRDQIFANEENIAQLEAQIYDQKEVIKLKEELIDQNQQSTRQLNADICELQKTVTDKMSSIKGLEESATEQRHELDQKTCQIEEANNALKQRNIEISELQEKVSENGEVIAKLTESITEKECCIEEKNTAISTANASIKNLNAEILSLQDTVSDSVEAISRLEEDRNQQDTVVTSLQAEIVTYQEKIETTQETLLHKEQELTTKTELLNAMEGSLAETTRSLECELLSKKIVESELSNSTCLLAARDSELRQLHEERDCILQKQDELRALSSQQSLQLKANRNDILSLEKEKRQMADKMEEKISELNTLAKAKTVSDAEKFKLKEELLAVNAENASFESKISVLNVEAIQASEKLNTLQSSLLSQKEANNQLSKEISEVQREKNELETQLAIENDAVEMRSQLLADATDQIDHMDKEKIALQETLRALESTYRDTSQQLVESKEEMDSLVANHHACVSALTTQLTDAEAKVTSISQEIAVISDRLQQAEAKSSSTDEAIQCIQEALDASDKKMSSDQLQQLQKTISTKNHGLGNLLIQVMTFASSHSGTQQQLNELEMKAKQANTQITTLQKSVEAMSAAKMKLESDIDTAKERENEEKSAKMRERFARLETVSKLESLQQQVDSIKAKYADAMAIVKSRDEELRNLRATIRELKESTSTLQIELAEVNKEKDKLCGHQNNKQKIQLHMLLKKNIEEQTQSLKHMQEQLSKVTQERDHAIDEARRLQQHHHHAPSATTVSKKLAAGEASSASVPQMVRRSQVKRTPLADTTASSDNRLAVQGSSSHAGDKAATLNL